MTDHECARCGSKSSIFWWRHGLHCDYCGNNGQPFELCDECMLAFVSFMKEDRKEGKR